MSARGIPGGTCGEPPMRCRRAARTGSEVSTKTVPGSRVRWRRPPPERIALTSSPAVGALLTRRPLVVDVGGRLRLRLARGLVAELDRLGGRLSLRRFRLRGRVELDGEVVADLPDLLGRGVLPEQLDGALQPDREAD